MVSKKIIGLSVVAIVIVSFVSILLFFPKPTISNVWIVDPTFDLVSDSPWSLTEGGDISDVQGEISSGEANFQILGDSQTFSDISGTPNSSSSLGWQKYQNENLQFPQKAIINSSGVFVSHIWNEVEFGGINQTKNYPSVHYRNTISLPVDMSDYVITVASLDVIFNATVGSNIDTPNDDYTGSQDEDLFAIGDFAIFYVLISDINYTNSYTVGYNKTKYLGQFGNGNPSILSISNSPLSIVDEADLIRALNSALQKDINHSRIVVSLCIDIFSEDNDNSGDHDNWEALIINQCNLTFSYQKIINQFTTVSFNQVGDKINGEEFQIVSSNLNFKYKIDKVWPTEAPLSELRLYINEKLFIDDVYKLNGMNNTFQEAKLDGFDVTNYLETNTNVSIAIEVDLKDTFELNETITVSIDEIYLNIELKETEDDLTYFVYILGGAFAGLMVFFTIYEKYLKYPKIVRKVRKLRKKIRKNNSINKAVLIRARTEIISTQLSEKTKILELKQLDSFKSRQKEVD